MADKRWCWEGWFTSFLFHSSHFSQDKWPSASPTLLDGGLFVPWGHCGQENSHTMDCDCSLLDCLRPWPATTTTIPLPLRGSLVITIPTTNPGSICCQSSALSLADTGAKLLLLHWNWVVQSRGLESDRPGSQVFTTCCLCELGQFLNSMPQFPNVAAYFLLPKVSVKTRMFKNI